MKKLLALLSILVLFVSCVSNTIENRDQIVEKQVQIEADGFEIPAILTLPKGNQPCAVVIMEHGTGSQKMRQVMG